MISLSKTSTRRSIEGSDWIKYPVAVLNPEVTQHGEWFLTFFQDGNERHHTLRHSCLQLKRCGFWICNVGNHKIRQPRKQSHCFRKVLCFRLVEVEDHGQKTAISQFFS